MPTITLNRKNRFSFSRKIKETSLTIKIPTLLLSTSSSFPTRKDPNKVQENSNSNHDHYQDQGHSFLIDNEDICTIKTKGESLSLSSSFSSTFSSPTLTASSKNNNDDEGNDISKELYLSSLPSMKNTIGHDPSNSVLISSNGHYSNFYLKLPNGKWLVKVRTREGKILGIYELDACMI